MIHTFDKGKLKYMFSQDGTLDNCIIIFVHIIHNIAFVHTLSNYSIIMYNMYNHENNADVIIIHASIQWK